MRFIFLGILSLCQLGCGSTKSVYEEEKSFPFYYFEGIVISKETGEPLPETFGVFVSLLDDSNHVVYGDFAKPNGTFEMRLRGEHESKVSYIQVHADMCKVKCFPYERTNHSLFFLKTEIEFDSTLFLRDTSFLYAPHSKTIWKKQE